MWVDSSESWVTARVRMGKDNATGFLNWKAMMQPSPKFRLGKISRSQLKSQE